ncbi:hypothetical protein NQ315_017408 [Exocentrus adspersus]|uniref:Transposase n=1 Tax=Exocentrus adspersus TaxID=1586481 RepID=A0AAV8VKT0_9CUCU|nr:hypothetical protein NQ315_017408 [Exocentrus adspersus]
MAREVLNPQSRKLVLNVLEYFQNKKETSSENISVINCAAEALKLSPRTISRIRQEGFSETTVPAKRKAYKTRDLHDGVKSTIRTVIYNMIENKQFVTRENLRLELVNRQILDVSKTTLSIILKGIGFRFAKDNGRRALMERPEIASKRVDFLREYITNAKCESPLDVVFLDETWIFQHGSNTLQTWHDNDVKSVRKKHCSEGKRYIIVHAGNKEGFIDGAGLIFSTKNKSADYHDNMNSELFEKWMEEQLLPRLKKPSLIVMDNARYHSRLMEKIPNTQSTKDEIIQWLQSKNIPIPQHAFKCELLQIVHQFKPKNIAYAIDELIYKMGHSVLRLPPYHCQFNAIELIMGTM